MASKSQACFINMCLQLREGFSCTHSLRTFGSQRNAIEVLKVLPCSKAIDQIRWMSRQTKKWLEGKNSVCEKWLMKLLNRQIPSRTVLMSMTIYYSQHSLLEYTVHSESIQTPWLFPHFVMLQPYSKLDSIAFCPSSIYPQYPIITKQKLVIFYILFCKFIQIKNTSNLHKYSDPFT